MSAGEAFILGIVFAALFGFGWQQRSAALIGLTALLGAVAVVGEWANSDDDVSRLSRNAWWSLSSLLAPLLFIAAQSRVRNYGRGTGRGVK